MCWDTIQVTEHMTPAGAKSKSSFAPPKAFRRSASTQQPATTPQATSHNKLLVLAAQAILPMLVLFSASLFLPSASAQDTRIAVPNSQPPPPNQDPNRQ